MSFGYSRLSTSLISFSRTRCKDTIFISDITIVQNKSLDLTNSRYKRWKNLLFVLPVCYLSPFQVRCASLRLFLCKGSEDGNHAKYCFTISKKMFRQPSADSRIWVFRKIFQEIPWRRLLTHPLYW